MVWDRFKGFLVVVGGVVLVFLLVLRDFIANIIYNYYFMKNLIVLIVRFYFSLYIGWLILKIMSRRVRFYFMGLLGVVLVAAVLVLTVLGPTVALRVAIDRQQEFVDQLFPGWVDNVTFVSPGAFRGDSFSGYKYYYVVCSGVVKRLGVASLVLYPGEKYDFPWLPKDMPPEIRERIINPGTGPQAGPRILSPIVRAVVVSDELADKLGIGRGDAVLYLRPEGVSAVFRWMVQNISNKSLEIVVGEPLDRNSSISLGEKRLIVRMGGVFPFIVNPAIDPSKVPIIALDMVFSSETVLVVREDGANVSGCAGYVGLVNARYSGEAVLHVDYRDLRERVEERISLFYEFPFETLSVFGLLVGFLVVLVYVGDARAMWASYRRLFVSLGLPGGFMARRLLLEGLVVVLAVGAGYVLAVLWGW